MDDEILKELRALREHLVAQHGGSLRAFGEYLMPTIRQRYRVRSAR